MGTRCNASACSRAAAASEHGDAVRSDPLPVASRTIRSSPVSGTCSTRDRRSAIRTFKHLFGVAGQDINVVPVWNMTRDDGGIGYTGKGVMVAVIDTGVQIGHPDLADNISPTLRFNAITGTNNSLPT